MEALEAELAARAAGRTPGPLVTRPRRVVYLTAVGPLPEGWAAAIAEVRMRMLERQPQTLLYPSPFV